MKRFVLVFLVSLSSLFTSAAVITWNGGVTGNWNNATNWLPATIPTSTDDVIFNTSALVDMDVFSSTTYAINSLRITGNVTVELNVTQSGGGTRRLQLMSTSTSTKGLQIDSGSTLLMHGVHTTGTLNYILDLASATGVTGEISGELQFSGIGSGGAAGNNHAELNVYTDGSNYANLIVKTGGIVKYIDLSGNTNSNNSGTYFTMESGSQYIIEKNGGSVPAGGAWDANSLLKVYNASGANVPTFNGDAYGNLEWNCPNQNSFSFTKNISFNNVNLVNTNAGSSRVFRIVNSGSIIYTLTINGNLDISSNSILEITGSGTGSPGGGYLIVKGNINNQGSITTNGIPGTVNQLELNGTTNQSLSNTGTFSGTRLLFIMNNAAGATLNTPLTLPYNLALTSGKITTTTSNLLTMIDGSAYTGGSVTSFIDGPMKKIGNTDFTFPVGKGGIYAPIGISGGIGATVTDEFTAEYLRTNPQTPFGNQYGASGINHVSYVEYWTLERNILSTATKLITLDVHPTSFCIVEGSTFVSQFDGTFWTNEPSTGSVFTTCNAPYRCGTLTTNDPISNFTLSPSIFTLATTDPFATNPLPIKLINFSATKISSGLAVINWDLAECCSKFVIFELEKSSDSRNFVLLSSISGSETNKFYFYNDSRLGKGITYYRLKMTDTDGSVKYSKVIAIINEEKGFVITSIAPNPVQHTASLTISAAKQSNVDFKVYDMTGNLVKQWQSTVASGINVVNMDVSALANGTYHVLASSADDKAVIRFIKQ